MEYVLPEVSLREWHGSQAPTFAPTERQGIVIAAVSKALTSGLFYTSDVLAFCIKEMLAKPEQVAAQFSNRPVEGGLIGMDCYYARQYIEAQAAQRARVAAADQLKASLGMALGTLVFNDSKRTTNCVITSIADNGLAYKVAGRRGRSIVSTSWLDATQIADAMNRAFSAGLCKANFETFLQTRTTCAAPSESTGSLC